MIDPTLVASVQDLIYREARLLDARRWQEWVSLYCPDAVFWVPAFRMDGSLTSDPSQELNLIYIAGRDGLEARIFRLETDISLSSTPAPATNHVVGMVMVDAVSQSEIEAFASWQLVWVNDVRGQQVRAGSYEYRLRRTGDDIRIAQKKVLLQNPQIDGYFDFFAV